MKEQALVIASECSWTICLCEALDREGYVVQWTIAPSEPLGADLILLALDSDTHELIAQCRQMRGLERAPMLVWLRHSGGVTAALRHGADDCVTGAADLSEVMARAGALLRRARREHISNVLIFGRVRVDVRKGSADLGHGAVPLTPKELSLFSYLAQHAGNVVARDELLREVWGYSVIETRTVDTHIAALRRKLEPDPRRPGHLFTVRGRGYQFRL